MKRKIVILTHEQYNYGLELAKKRNAKESKFGAMTYGNKRGGLEAHLIGIIPEIAVARILGVNVDERIFDNHGDDGVDLVSEVGKIGVKTTTYGNDPFLRVELEHFADSIDFYILCYYEPQKDKLKVEIIGWASKDEVSKAPQRRFLRNGPMNYVLTEECLHEFK